MSTKAINFLFASLLVMTLQTITHAQTKTNRHTKKKAADFYIGPEFLAGTHAFQFKSDIDKLNNLRVSQSGTSIGGLVGHRMVKAHVRKGRFSSENYVNERVRTSLVEGSLNIFPMQFTSKRFRSFEPYGIIGISKTNYQLFGDYVSLPPPPQPKAKPCTCPCLCGDVMVDPEASSHVASDALPAEPQKLPPGSDLGRIITRDFFAGVGAEGHIQRKGYFVHLFAEMKYAMPRKISVTNPAFERTNVAVPLIMQVGIAAGLSSR